MAGIVVTAITPPLGRVRDVSKSSALRFFPELLEGGSVCDADPSNVDACGCASLSDASWRGDMCGSCSVGTAKFVEAS